MEIKNLKEEKHRRPLKIFLPFQKVEYHPYLNEIKEHSKFRFVMDEYDNYDSSFPIVNIHWPEAIFNWREPLDFELDLLQQHLLIWKKTAKIVYTKHDFEPLKGATGNFKKLFIIVEENTDFFIHLGHFSLNLYSAKYPKAQHKVISHPLFETSFKKISKSQARKVLDIDSNAFVVAAPGKIRSFQERRLVIRSFKAIEGSNKVLICNNMRSELKYDFPGRVRLKKIFDVQQFAIKSFKKKYSPPTYLFDYKSLDSEALSLRIAAADIILIPRINLLNSGNVLLGLTFGKITVGPAVGNIREQLEELKLPTFDPKSQSSTSKAIQLGKALVKESFSVDVPEKYLPFNVAQKYDELFIELIGDET